MPKNRVRIDVRSSASKLTPVKPVIIDGGMGRQLLTMGAPFRQPEWSALALFEGPEWVKRAHLQFIDAGCDVITTNSYAIVPFHIGDRFRTDGARLADLAGQLAVEAAAQSDRAVQIAGSLPPLFGSYQPELFNILQAPEIATPLIESQAPHVDLWLAETMGSIAEATFIVELLEQLDSDRKPVWVSLTLDDEAPVGSAARLRSGEPVQEAVAELSRLETVSAIMFNCCQPETITPALVTAMERLADVARGIQVGAYPNAFTSSHDTEAANSDTSELRNDLGAAALCDVVKSWLDTGATIFGGCCGIGPTHIAAIADMVRGASGGTGLAESDRR